MRWLFLRTAVPIYLLALLSCGRLYSGVSAKSLHWGPPNKYGVQIAIQPTAKIFRGGQDVTVRATIRNRGPQPWSLEWGWDIFGQYWIEFSLTGPSRQKTPLTAYEAYISQFPASTFDSGVLRIRSGQTFKAGIYTLNHNFDMTLPGIYHAVGDAEPGGQFHCVSPSTPIRVAPPAPIRGPSIVPTQSVKTFLWGKPQNGLQFGIKLRKSIISQFKPVFVIVAIRNVGVTPHRLDLRGLSAEDFPYIKVNGPTGVKYLSPKNLKPLIFNKTQLTAYGRWLTHHLVKAAASKAAVLAAGKTYVYAKPILLNRRFDLTMAGIYSIQVALAGTDLHSGVVRMAVCDEDYFSVSDANKWQRLQHARK